MLSKTFLAAALAGLATAQTSTTCDPTKKSCPDDAGLGAKPYEASSFSKTPAQFTEQSGDFKYDSGEAEFVISKQGNAPTLISSFYIFFGTVEVNMKAASGQGIVSSIVLESDDLDEIDWEMLGGNTKQVETNYFGKGDTTTYDRATYVNVDTPQNTYHNYTLNWTKDQLDWMVDGQIIRTLKYADAQGGSRYPQTPMRLRIGTWAGGDPSNAPGTIHWAGGKTSYDQTYTANVKSIRVVDAGQGTAYSYGDHSGSWQSIKVSKDQAAGASASSNLQTGTAAATATGPAANPSGVATNGTASGSGSGSNSTVTGGSGGSGPTPTSSGAASTGSAKGAASVMGKSAALGAAAAVVGFGMALL